MPDQLIVDCSTGETSAVPYTDSDTANQQAMAASGAVVAAALEAQTQAAATVAELAASIPGHILQAQADAATIATLQPGQELTAEQIAAMTNHANGWVTLLEGLRALLAAQGIS